MSNTELLALVESGKKRAQSARDDLNLAIQDLVDAHVALASDADRTQLDELRAENARLREALRKLLFAAQTSGGVAGTDNALINTIDEARKALGGTNG